MFDPKVAKPREIEAYLREVVRKSLGDKAENDAKIFARRGYYTVAVELEDGKCFDFVNFRRDDTMKVAKAIRAMK